MHVEVVYDWLQTYSVVVLDKSLHPEDQLSTPLIALELQSSQNFKDFYNFLQMCNS